MGDFTAVVEWALDAYLYRLLEFHYQCCFSVCNSAFKMKWIEHSPTHVLNFLRYTVA